MPIEVHCPNPVCARVHLVKNKYATMRGKCPDCASWMYVPALGMMPSMITPRPEGIEEVVARPLAEGEPRPARAAKAAAISLAEVDLGPPPEPAPPKKAAARRPVEEAEDEVLADADDETAEPKKPFSKLAAVLVVLAILALGAMAAVPFLPGPGRRATEGFTSLNLVPDGIPQDKIMFVAAAPGPVILLLLLALLMGFALREWGGLPKALVYIAAFLVAGLGFLALHILQQDLASIKKITKETEGLRSKGRTGEYEPLLGMQLPVACGAIGAGAVLLLLAAMLMHRRWWSRVLCFFVLTAPLALAGVWVFRDELGVGSYIPI